MAKESRTERKKAPTAHVEQDLPDIPELPDLPGLGLVCDEEGRTCENPPFSKTTIKHAWVRAAGNAVSQWAYCECPRTSLKHDHREREACGKRLAWKSHGRGSGPGAWEANHRHRNASGGPDIPSNCEILCWPCHKATFSRRRTAARPSAQRRR